MRNLHSRMIVLCRSFFLLAVCTTVMAQDSPQPVDVTGHWSILSVSAFGQEGLKSVELTQEGNQIRGFFKGTNQQGTLSGFVDGDRIFFSTHTRFVLNFRGKIEGNTMSGRLGVRGKVGEWTATKFGAPEVGQPGQ